MPIPIITRKLGMESRRQLLLYRHLNLLWRFSLVQTLLDSFTRNPSLYLLVRSCSFDGYSGLNLRDDIIDEIDYESFFLELGYTAQEVAEDDDRLWEATEWARDERIADLVIGHEDLPWAADERSTSHLALVNLLRSLTHLQELELNYMSDEDELTHIPALLASDLDWVLGNLTTFKLLNSSSPLSQRLLSGTCLIDILQLIGTPSKLPVPPLPNLRHLTIRKNQRVWGQNPTTPVEPFSDTLTTLSIGPLDYIDQPYVSVPLPHLTHLQLIYEFTETVSALESTISLLSFTPNRRQLSLYKGPVLKDIIPILPSTVTSVQSHVKFVNHVPPKGWFDSLFEACSRRSSTLDLALHIEDLSGGVDCADLIGKARDRGVNLGFIELPFFFPSSRYVTKSWYEDAVLSS